MKQKKKTYRKLKQNDLQPLVDPQKRNRTSYPSIRTTQMDNIYHNGIDGWKTTIAVKDKHPKE